MHIYRDEFSFLNTAHEIHKEMRYNFNPVINDEVISVDSIENLDY